MNAGDTLLVAEPGTSYDSHLWIVVSDPSSDPDHVVMVNMTSFRTDKDQACVIHVGDHPYVTHDTCINYEDAKVVTVPQIELLRTSGKVVSFAPCSSSLLQRIRDAVPDSRMKLGVVSILVDQSVIEDI